MIDSKHITSSAERVDMERHTNVRAALALLKGEHPNVPRADVQRTVAQIMLASVEKQARWNG